MAMMGYTVSGYYKLKEKKKLQHKLGMFTFSPEDVFTKSKDGTYMVHTGVCMFGIKADDEDFTFFPGSINLVGV